MLLQNQQTHMTVNFENYDLSKLDNIKLIATFIAAYYDTAFECNLVPSRLHQFSDDVISIGFTTIDSKRVYTNAIKYQILCWSKLFNAKAYIRPAHTELYDADKISEGYVHEQDINVNNLDPDWMKTKEFIYLQDKLPNIQLVFFVNVIKHSWFKDIINEFLAIMTTLNTNLLFRCPFCQSEFSTFTIKGQVLLPASVNYNSGVYYVNEHIFGHPSDVFDFISRQTLYASCGTCSSEFETGTNRHEYIKLLKDYDYSNCLTFLQKGV